MRTAVRLAWPIVLMFIAAACSDDGAPQHGDPTEEPNQEPWEVDEWGGRCTEGTDPDRCELARCFVVEPAPADFAVRITNRCDHEVRFLLSEGTEAELLLNPFWSLRWAESGVPYNVMHEIPVTWISTAESYDLVVPPTHSGLWRLPRGMMPCGATEAVFPRDGLLTASFTIVAPVPIEQEDPGWAPACHATACEVGQGVRCDEQPNRVVFEDVMTFSFKGLCEDYPPARESNWYRICDSLLQ